MSELAETVTSAPLLCLGYLKKQVSTPNTHNVFPLVDILQRKDELIYSQNPWGYRVCQILVKYNRTYLLQGHFL